MVLQGGKENLHSMLSSKVPLDKLVLGKSMQHVLLRVLRMWEPRNFKLNGTLMSLDLLLLDENETLIQGSIYHRRIHRFRDLLEEGKMYLISDFEVVPTYSHYKVTDNPFIIRFMDKTQIIEVDESLCSIKLEKFRVHTYGEFNSFAGTNLHLLDVVGQILEVQGSNLEDSNSKQKIMLLLLIEENKTVKVTLWDDQATEFRKIFQHTGRTCSAIVCTCLNPKLFAGKLQLNSSGSTKIYINHDLIVVKEFMKRMGIEDNITPGKIIEESSANKTMEIWTIGQILEYISSGESKEKEVICRGKVIDISTRNGWKYLSCATCSKKLGRSMTSLICNACQKPTTIGVAKVEFEVEIGERTTTFVLFDRDARKLTHTTAEEILETEEIRGEEKTDTNLLPTCLQGIVGKTMDFQVKISEFNFQASFQTFTITRIINDNSLLDQSLIIPSKKGEQKKNDLDLLPQC